METIIQQIRSSLCDEFEKLFRERVSQFNKNLAKISNLSIKEIDKCWVLGEESQEPGAGSLPVPRFAQLDPDLILPPEEEREKEEREEDSSNESEEIKLPLLPSKPIYSDIELPPTQDFEEDIFEVIEREKKEPPKIAVPPKEEKKVEKKETPPKKEEKKESKIRILPAFLKEEKPVKKVEQPEEPVKKEPSKEEKVEPSKCSAVLGSGIRKGQVCGRINCHFHQR